MAPLLLLRLLLLASLARAARAASGPLGSLSRDGAFVGYFEERVVRLVSEPAVGSIRVRLRPSAMPRTASLLADALGGGAPRLNGTWYRNEEVPLPAEGAGPPYGLLQGKMLGVRFPREANEEHVGNGTVCAIPDGDAFLITTMDHDEWRGSFTVLGYVPLDDAESWATIRRIIDMRWRLLVHPDYGTHMRMLEAEVPFAVFTEEEHSIREAREARDARDARRGWAPAQDGARRPPAASR